MTIQIQLITPTEVSDITQAVDFPATKDGPWYRLHFPPTHTQTETEIQGIIEIFSLQFNKLWLNRKESLRYSIVKQTKSKESEAGLRPCCHWKPLGLRLALDWSKKKLIEFVEVIQSWHVSVKSCILIELS
jgi:hypothetical protein